jgi:threonine/homoserine/homoserine lactone efflux protein
MTPPVDPARYAAYLGVMSVLVATPGPANLFAIATGAHRGKAAVLRAVAGMNLASLVWFAAAILGLSSLAHTAPILLHLLAYVGAAYVAWLGLRALWSTRGAEGEAAHAPKVQGRSAFRDGFAVQISNPKALLFTTVILPPFLDADRPLADQFAALTLSVLAMDVIAMTAYGFGGAAIAARMTEPRFRRGFSLFTGLLLITAAGLIVLRA